MKKLIFAAACACLVLAACQSTARPIALATAQMRADVTTAIGRAVMINQMKVTPLKVVEDSRCAAEVRCVWAGRLIVQTEIDAPGGAEQLQLDLELGKPVNVYGGQLTIVDARPVKRAAQPLRQSDYRFIYRFER